MAQDDEKVELGTVEARAGQSNHVTRYVLPISLALFIVIFIAVFALYR